jgi:hypothetical protein
MYSKRFLHAPRLFRVTKADAPARVCQRLKRCANHSVGPRASSITACLGLSNECVISSPKSARNTRSPVPLAKSSSVYDVVARTLCTRCTKCTQVHTTSDGVPSPLLRGLGVLVEACRGMGNAGPQPLATSSQSLSTSSLSTATQVAALISG